MSQWKNDDSAANSVLWGVSGYKVAANAANRDAFFGNTTNDSFITGLEVGQFGVDTTEMGVTSGTLIEGLVTFAGSGYGANAVITLSGGGGASGVANAQAGATGRITAINISTAGSSYETNPTVAIAAPAAVTFNALSAVSNTAETITISSANSRFLVGDKVRYAVAAGNTAVGGLVSNTDYFIAFSNSTVITLAPTLYGANINLTASVTETGHSLQGETATGVVVASGARGVSHAGWVVRSVGTGGRAGRIQYETLVAMGSMTGDAEDTVLPDS
jgi:hypothetical protein